MIQKQTNWSNEEVNILKINYGILTYKEIAILLPNRTVFQIRNKCNYMGLCSTNNLRKYSVNKEYFSTYNIQNCYWAGFIAADGNIYKNRLSIGLAHKDKDLLDNFVRDINYTNAVKIYKDRVSVTINSIEIVKDLNSNFNIVEKKSKILEPPYNITNRLLRNAFIKGVIDGDGSISKNNYSITIYGTKALLDWICIHFNNIIPVINNYNRSKVIQIQPNLFAYKISGNRAHYIINEFNKLNTYKLKRKWNIQ